ncbi:MAG: O-antigen ligase family protein [Eubacteriales bacterium]
MKLKTGKFSELVSSSALMKLAKRMYFAAFSGFFGTAATGYRESQARFEAGFFGGERKKDAKSWSSSPLSRLRRAAIVSYEKSYVRRVFSAAAEWLLGCYLKFYGFFFLYFGLSVLLMNFIKRFAFSSDRSDNICWFIGGMFFLISLPLLTSRKKLAPALSESLFFSFLLCRVLGISELVLNEKGKNSSFGSKRYFLAAFTGALLGCISFFISPAFLPISLLTLLALVLVASSPASGILLTVFTAPFALLCGASPAFIALPIIYTCVCMIGKVFLGRLIFRFEISDFFVCLFLAVTLGGGIVTMGGAESRASSLLLCTLLLFYFAFVTLITTREWLMRTVKTAVFSAAAASAALPLVSLASFIETDLPLSDFFSFFGKSTLAASGSAYSFGVFLSLMLPFFILEIMTGEKKASRLLSLLFFAASFAGLLIFGSFGVKIGTVVSLIVFALFCSYKVLPAVIPSALLAITVFEASNTRQGLGETLSVLANAAASRFELWRNSFTLAKGSLFSGVGIGNAAIENACLEFASVGQQISPHCRNQYLQTLIELGIPGLLLFIVSLWLILKSGLYLVRFGENRNATERAVCVAGISGLVAVLVEGIADCVFDSPYTFFAFFAVASIVSASSRIGRKRTLSNSEY